MARLIQAIQAFGSKLERQKTAQLEAVAEWMSMRTGLNKSEVMMVLQEQSEAILFFNKQGIPVKFPGVGTFSPSISRDGEYRVNFRTDVALKKGINQTDAYTGNIINPGRIGLDDLGYKDLWDADHPEDPLEI
jgi:hypothetical protein